MAGQRLLTKPTSPIKKYAIIVAGGRGSRMQAGLPKQFISIGGKPMLMHTIQRFAEYIPAKISGSSPTGVTILVVLPEQEFPTWHRLCREHHFNIPVQLVAGGQTRFQSVRNGLRAIGGDGLVAIHDGVRPFVSAQVIERSFQVAAAKGSAITTVPLKDSVRQVEGESSRSVDRSLFRLIQTPQTFQLSLIRKAFQQDELPDFTDDASVAERAGFPIHLIEGSYENLKITTPEDLVWAEALLKKITS